MLKKSPFIILILLVFFVFSASVASAKDKEFDSVVKHLKTNYQAKKVKIPFMWLAKIAVKIVKPAGVRSFRVTMFEGLRISKSTLDREMQSVMKNSLSPEWESVFRVRSRTGEQVYMYMREQKDSVKIMLVTIENDQAAVIRATVNPEKLADFINNPKVMGISLDSNNNRSDLNKFEEKK